MPELDDADPTPPEEVKERLRQGCQERMLHACAGPMGEGAAGEGSGREVQQGGDVAAGGQGDGEGCRGHGR